MSEKKPSPELTKVEKEKYYWLMKCYKVSEAYTFEQIILLKNQIETLNKGVKELNLSTKILLLATGFLLFTAVITSILTP